MHDLFGGFLQGRPVEVGMLGGAQIDRFGNLNTTVIGDTRTQGAAAGLRRSVRDRDQCQRVIVVMHQSSARSSSR